MRWWDGSKWTENVQEIGPSSPSPYGASPADNSSAKPWYTMKRWWVLGVVALFVVIGAVSGGESADESEPTASEPGATAESESTEKPSKGPKPTKEPEPTKAPAAEPQAVRVQAGQMLDEFDGNEAAADAKYKGKVVEVTGNVAKVDTEFLDDDQYVVRLDGGGNFAILSVNCNDVAADEAAKVQPESTVTVRGEFDDGGDLGVEIKDCEVL